MISLTVVVQFTIAHATSRLKLTTGVTTARSLLNKSTQAMATRSYVTQRTRMANLVLPLAGLSARLDAQLCRVPWKAYCKLDHTA